MTTDNVVLQKPASLRQIKQYSTTAHCTCPRTKCTSR